MIQKINSIKDTVLHLLHTEPDTRDNDRLLMLKVWALQNPVLRSNKATYWAWAKSFRDGEYACPESIIRIRRKAQEQYPHIRGNHYKERKEKHEPEMRNAMPRLDMPRPASWQHDYEP